MSKILAVTLMLVMCAGQCVWAGESADKSAVRSTVEKAMTLYDGGNVSEAIATLQEAISLMQTTGTKSMAAMLPSAPTGWQKGEVESQSMTAQGLNFNEISCQYTRSSDGLGVRIQLCNSPQMIETHKSVAEAYKNPQMLAAMNQGQQIKIAQFSRDEWVGWTRTQQDDTSELVAFNNSNLLTIHLDKPDENVLEQFIGLIDFKALAGAE
jgi:hypothetical protein